MMNFALLHRQDGPLLIANVWDVSSARTAQAAGYQALGTSSAVIAAMYGYADGDGITFAELHHLLVRLRACCPLPLTVDMSMAMVKVMGRLSKTCSRWLNSVSPVLISKTAAFSKESGC
jgi:2-methylisocitrate lyase-like PEP mutase family enzyme